MKFLLILLLSMQLSKIHASQCGCDSTNNYFYFFNSEILANIAKSIGLENFFGFNNGCGCGGPSATTTLPPTSAEPGPTTTSGPPATTTTRSASAIALTNAYSNIFSGGDVAAAKETWISTTIASGGKPDLIGQFVDSMKALAEVLVSNPNETQKALISAAAIQFFNDGEAFIADQPGLANFGTDPDIVNDPKFADFAALYRFLSNQVEQTRNSPETAKEFFDSAVTSWGDFFDQLPKFAVQIAEKKLNKCPDCVLVDENAVDWTAISNLQTNPGTEKGYCSFAPSIQLAESQNLCCCANLTATSASPTTTTVSATAVGISNALVNIFSGTDLQASKDAFVQALTTAGANVELAPALVNSFSSMTGVLVPQPDELQKAQIIEAITNLSKSFVNFVESQPGLQNPTTNPAIVNDPSLSYFSPLFAQLLQDFQDRKTLTDTAFEFFSGSVGRFGNFLAEVVKVSKMVVAKTTSGP